MSHRAAARFYRETGPRTPAVHFGAAYAGCPVVYNRSEACQTLHTAALEAVRECLPSDDLHPVRTSADRGVIAVTSFRHGEITAHGVHGQALMPYGEVMVAVLATRRPAPPLLPLVAPRLARQTAGAFVLHLPVTHRAARDGGRLAWGYPKFIADMVFEDSLETLCCTLSEAGEEILTHTVWPRGRPSVMSESLTLYSALDGELLALDVPISGIVRQRRGPSGGRLELGDHQIADELRKLEINPEPILTRRMTDLHLALTFGQAVGAARQYLGYIGEDRDFGRYTVRYGSEAPIDMYAPPGQTAKPPAAVELGAPTATRQA